MSNPLRCSRARALVLLGLLLTIGTWLCYRSLSANGFISFDDSSYVIHNDHVNRGLTWSGIAWAFVSVHASNWHPLTWISHMLDCQMFGLDPAGHHLISLLFHTANSLLLFVFLERVTRALSRSFVVAALFAWHPLHVESVAWISERKDVLSTFFFLLMLLAYSRYAGSRRSNVERPGPAAQDSERSTVDPRPSMGFYFLALALFALGLMSKPMLVTVPVLLVLLDFWPLKRLPNEAGRVRFTPALLREKLPFVALSAASCVITFLAQHQGGAVSSLATVPLTLRLSNAVVSYTRYVVKMFWPANLSIIYPLPEAWPPLVIAAGALLLVVVSWLAFQSLRQIRAVAGGHAPEIPAYFGVGWLWFVVTLFPVIGIIQVGTQAIADRYMYIPSIGLFIMIVWGVAGLVNEGKNILPNVPSFAWRPAAIFPATAALACLAVSTGREVDHWKTGETLFRRALEVDPDNYAAYDALGSAFAESGKLQEALNWYSKAAEMAPGYAQGRFNLGALLLQLGRNEEAVPHLRAAAALNPGSCEVQQSLGTALMNTGQKDEAIVCLQRAVTSAPSDSDARYALGLALLQSSKLLEAASEFQAVLELNPRHLEAHRNLGVALAQLGHIPEAANCFAAAVRLAPEDPGLRFNLGMASLDLAQPEQALRQFSEGVRLTPADPNQHYWLGVAAARLHRNEDALAHYREALRLRPDFPEATNAIVRLLATSGIDRTNL
jgi:protein O-mannosyl-transferase